jgi:2-methylcitrate dehydratase
VSAHISDIRPDPDKVLVDIVDYVEKYKIASKDAYETARSPHGYVGCVEALSFLRPAMGPIVAAPRPNGRKSPAPRFSSTPCKRPSTSAMIRGSTSTTRGSPPSGDIPDNLGGVLATADWISRNNLAAGKALTVRDVLTAMIKAHEIRA